MKNVVISGTNFWNPGDDFVRRGVQEIFSWFNNHKKVNTWFYNFNPDQTNLRLEYDDIAFKYSNTLEKDDLRKIKYYLDAIIIIGLSAGHEINPLYDWILENDLEKKVYIVGGGYESEYCEWHLNNSTKTQEIFKNAKIVIGRTKKYPRILDELNIKYHYLPCPSILSNFNLLRDPNEEIKNILFSIQPDQTTTDLCWKMYNHFKNEGYNVQHVCHHKSEFKNLPDEVFSSFYEDLIPYYKNTDLVISTRLHSCLYANSLNKPAILVNNTPRHLEAQEDFKYCSVATTEEEIQTAFNIYRNSKLSHIFDEIFVFQLNLLNKYLELLKGV